MIRHLAEVATATKSQLGEKNLFAVGEICDEGIIMNNTIPVPRGQDHALNNRLNH